MAAQLTNGYDLVFELSPNHLRRIILRHFLNISSTDMLDSSIPHPFPIPGLPGGINVNISQVSIFVLGRNTIRLVVDLEQVLIIGQRLTNVRIALDLDINFTNDDNIRLSITNVSLPTFDVNDSELNAVITFIRGLGIDMLLRDRGIDPENLSSVPRFREFLRTQIITAIQRDLIDLGPMDRILSTTPCAISLREIRVVMFGNAIFLLVAITLQGNNNVLRPEAFNGASSFRGTQESGIRLSNTTLLDLLICFATNTPGSPLFNNRVTRAGNCRNFATPIPITLTSLNIPEIGFREDLTFFFRSLSVCIVENMVMITGSGDLNYRTGTLFVDFSIPVRFVIGQNGLITPLIDERRVRINLRNQVEWWVTVGAVFGFIPPLPILSELSIMTIFLQSTLFSPLTGSLINLITPLTLPNIARSVNQTISRSLVRLIPTQVSDVLGLLEIGVVDLDDLEITGEFLLKNLPQVFIEEQSLVLQEDIVNENIAVVNSILSHQLTYSFVTRDFPAINRYKWSINGIDITNSRGILTLIDGHNLSYELTADRKCILRTELGKSLSCVVGLRVWGVNGYARTKYFQTNAMGISWRRNSALLDRIRVLSEDFVIIRRTPIDPVPYFSIINPNNQTLIAQSMKLDYKKLNDMITIVLNRQINKS